MTKRLRAAAAGEEEEVEISENNDVANFHLLVLSHHHGRPGRVAKARKQQKYVERTFECKTCYRQFPSFQALGGHCTTHKRSKAVAGTAARPKKPRIHECAVCGTVFSMGQALGGHMRRHKPTSTTKDLFRSSSSSDDDEEEDQRSCCSEDPKLLLLDLNLPPPEEWEEENHDLKLKISY